MPLEAVIIILDNSEQNRNGDFPPTRWDSQTSAVQILCQTKLQDNAESKVGVMTMAGKRPEIYVSGTGDEEDIIANTTGIKINGKANFFNAVKVAQLALKHRENQNAKKRIIAFIGHDIENSEEECEKLGKRLKMNNVAIDIINFASQVNVNKLETLIGNANSSENSHFLNVPPTNNDLTGILFTSPILGQGFGDVGGAMDGQDGMVVDQLQPGAAGGIQVDPSLDPELAEAIRLSMADDQPRVVQEQDTGANVDSQGAAGVQTGQLPIPDIQNTLANNEEESEDEEEQLRKAIELSMAPDGGQKEKKPEKKDDLMDVVTTDYLKDMVKDLDLDMDPGMVQNIMDDLDKDKKDDQKKDEEEKKDDDQKKDEK